MYILGERYKRKGKQLPKKTETDYNINDAHFVWHIQGHCYYSSDTLRLSVLSQQNSVDAVHITETTELPVNSEDKWVSLFSYLITF